MAKVSYKDIAKAIAIRLDDHDVSKVADEIATYLVEERRVDELDKILREVEQLELINRDVIEVAISSASELGTDTTDQIKEMIQERFQAAEVRAIKNIDKHLVGGVKIQALDTEIDLSVRGQLNQLRSHKF